MSSVVALPISVQRSVPRGHKTRSWPRWLRGFRSHARQRLTKRNLILGDRLENRSDQDQPKAVPTSYRLSARRCAKLAQDRTDMELRGVLGYPKLHCNLLVSCSPGEQRETSTSRVVSGSLRYSRSCSSASTFVGKSTSKKSVENATRPSLTASSALPISFGEELCGSIARTPSCMRRPASARVTPSVNRTNRELRRSPRGLERNFSTSPSDPSNRTTSSCKLSRSNPDWSE